MKMDNGQKMNNPNTLPPKVRQAIEQIIYWCNEDQEIVVPYSKKLIRDLLKTKGYKNDVIDRAIDESNVSWNDHALILAKIYFSVKKCKILVNFSVKKCKK